MGGQQRRRCHACAWARCGGGLSGGWGRRARACGTEQEEGEGEGREKEGKRKERKEKRKRKKEKGKRKKKWRKKKKREREGEKGREIAGADRGERSRVVTGRRAARVATSVRKKWEGSVVV